MEEERASTPALICQISNLPDEGIDLEGDVTFEELDIESDYRFTLDRPMHYRLHVSLAKQDVVVTCYDQGTEVYRRTFSKEGRVNNELIDLQIQHNLQYSSGGRKAKTN